VSEGLERRRGLLYGRRKGPKLSAHQAELRALLLPKLALRLERGRDPRTYFGVSVDEVWLEVGFGGGEHLVWQAELQPDIGMLGAEPYQSGVAKLLSKLDSHSAPYAQPSSPSLSERSNLRSGPQKLDRPHKACHDEMGRANSNEGRGASLLERIRIHEGDARDIVEALPDTSIGRVFILFPDPWPKKRHHKRRFIQMEILDKLARTMRAGAELRFATDDAGYLDWTLERLTAHPAFSWNAKRALDWTSRPDDWPPTRYETKALHGPPAYLRFCRV